MKEYTYQCEECGREVILSFWRPESWYESHGHNVEEMKECNGLFRRVWKATAVYVNGVK